MKRKLTEEEKAKYRTPEWKNFRHAVLVRDDYTCVICGKRSQSCNVHHKFYRFHEDGTMYDPGDVPMSDCITLCAECHMKFHDKLEDIVSREIVKIPVLSDYTSDEDKLIGGVWESTNYDKFEDIKGNREHKHSEKIKMSMLREGVADVPIVVVKGQNGKLIVIDGGTRMKARMELRYPIPYIVLSEGGLKLVIALNSATKGWGNNDYLKMYCMLGKESYLKLDEYAHKYSFLNTTSLTFLLSLNTHEGIHDNYKNARFQTGDFSIPNIYESDRIISFLGKIIEKKKEQGEDIKKLDNQFVRCIMTSFMDEKIDEKQFLNNLGKEEIGGTLVLSQKRQDYRGMIDDIIAGQTNLFTQNQD